MKFSLGTMRRSLIAVFCSLFFFMTAGCQAFTTELHSQKELSRTVGLFHAYRFVLYKGSDDDYYYFQETGKFGWLGPTEKFKISKTLILIQTTRVDSVATYDQNRGLFFIGSGPDAETIKANFVEKYTREEEEFLNAVERLNRISNTEVNEVRINAVNRAMMASYFAGHLKEAATFASEQIALVELIDKKSASKFPDGYGFYSDNVHSGNRILGLVALRNGDINAAKSYLIVSAKVPGSPVLGSFGPNMSLARELLVAGEKQTVLEYLALCEQFWKNDSLKRWEQDIESNRVPSFGANLSY